MITRQGLIVHLERKDSITEPINRLINRNGASIAESSLVSIITFKLKVLDVIRRRFSESHGVDVHSAMFENITHSDTAPLCRRHRADNPVRGNENLVIVIVHVLTTISSALQSCSYFELGELGLQIFQSKLVFLDSLSLHDQYILSRINVGNSQMVTNIKKFVGSDVVFCQEINTRFSTPRFDSAWEVVWITNRVGLKHITELTFLGFLGIFRREVANTILFHPRNDMATEMLTVYLPVWFQVLPGCHQEARFSTWMPMIKESEIVDSPTKGIPQGGLITMLRDVIYRNCWQIRSWGRSVVLRVVTILSMERVVLRGRVLLLRTSLALVIRFVSRFFFQGSHGAGSGGTEEGGSSKCCKGAVVLALEGRLTACIWSDSRERTNCSTTRVLQKGSRKQHGEELVNFY
mmetsp:Transcript_13327/g.22063  ORF Transcript_13327/g.22063 Transcript_13327/m.22063 type:complete len:406 (-) Transcript_13327:36-1253(-)